jgi:hypothetical protein
MSLLRYIDCDNAYVDLLSLLKQTLVQDEDGNWYIRVIAADESDIPVSVLTGVECGDTMSIEDILRNLLMIDTETGEISWAIYNVPE